MSRSRLKPPPGAEGEVPLQRPLWLRWDGSRLLALWAPEGGRGALSSGLWGCRGSREQVSSGSRHRGFGRTLPSQVVLFPLQCFGKCLRYRLPRPVSGHVASSPSGRKGGEVGRAYSAPHHLPCARPSHPGKPWHRSSSASQTHAGPDSPQRGSCQVGRSHLVLLHW